MLTLSRPINILFLISQSAAEENWLWNKNNKRRYLVKSWEKAGENTKNFDHVILDGIESVNDFTRHIN